MNTQQRCGRMFKITETWLNTAVIKYRLYAVFKSPCLKKIYILDAIVWSADTSETIV